MPSFLKKLKTDIAQEEPETKEKTKPNKKQDWLKKEGQLVVDVFYTKSDFCVQAPIAGVEREALDISIDNKMLIIKGERKEPGTIKEKNYSYQECYWGPFSRQILLPEDVDPQRIKASLEKGILLIKIPRIIKVNKKKVNVNVKD